MTDQPPAAGWYPDSTGRNRWWDGSAWTDRFEDSPAPVPSPPPPQPRAAQRPRPSWLVPLIVGSVALLIGLGIGYGVGAASYSGDTQESRSASNDAGSEDASSTEDEPEDVSFSPTADDFSVELSVKDRECFGSAGCNVTYRVKPGYVGTESPAGTWEITYELRGIEDGPQIETFTLDDDEFSFSPEISAQTTGPNKKVRALVTDVVESY
jgi:hypothetical protein